MGCWRGYIMESSCVKIPASMVEIGGG